MKIIYAGSGEFGLPTLRGLLDAKHAVELVVSQPDRPAGRGRQLTPTPIAQFAIEKNLPLLRTADINKESLPPADLLVVVAFGQKIAANLVTQPRLGSVNLHGSRLPKFRGALPVNAAILAGEKITGNSIIRLASKMDAGAILGQSEIPIGQLETAGELHDRLAIDGAILMLDVIEKLCATRRSIRRSANRMRRTRENYRANRRGSIGRNPPIKSRGKSAGSRPGRGVTPKSSTKPTLNARELN